MTVRIVPISAPTLQKCLRSARLSATAKASGRAFVSKVFPPEGVEPVMEPKGHGIVLLPSFAAERVPSIMGWLREQHMQYDLYGIYNIQRRRMESEGVFEGGLFMFASMGHQVHFRLMVDETRPYTTG